MKRIAGTEGFDALLSTMKYLGYTTHDESGELRDPVRATLLALKGRAIESVMLGATIATEYAKHVPARRHTGSTEYCQTCGCSVQVCRGHSAAHVRAVEEARLRGNSSGGLNRG